MIYRALLTRFISKVQPGKVVVLLGARRVGKTELLKTYLQSHSETEYLFLSGEDQRTLDLLENRSVENYRRIIGDKKLLAIDEAQGIPDIGRKLKLMVDYFSHLSIIATGSSALDLGNKTGEPLVGRAYHLQLFPLAQMEFSRNETLIETLERLDDRLIFGGYPELEHFTTREQKMDYLEEIVNSYLLKDILEYNGIRKSDKLLDLLRLLALQTGKEVSIDELANGLKGISRNTVEQYMDLLSKVFVIFKMPGFSRNLRKEINKTSRWFFYDTGIRNAIIRNFSPLKLRTDSGELWENYMITERMKYNYYSQKRVTYYFWRTYDRQEIDLIEEESGKLNAFEFKFSPPSRVKAPAGWSNAYPEAGYQIISRDNYPDFIGG